MVYTHVKLTVWTYGLPMFEEKSVYKYNMYEYEQVLHVCGSVRLVNRET